jgi:flagellar M-ring protein FliF
MNELRKTLVGLWSSLSVPQRVSIIASVLVVFAVLLGVVYLSSKPKMSLLFANLPTEEASKVVDFLQNKKVAYDLEDGGRTVMVPGNRVYELRLAMASAGIPRASDTAGGVGFELFDKATFGMSDFMQKANYYRALEGELARTIHQMDEVDEARVLIVPPEDRLFRPEKKEAKASVFVKLKQNRVLSQSEVQAIRFLVANGVEGLQPDHVAVIDNFGHALTQDQDGSSATAINAKQLQLVQATEDRLREKAQSMLDQVLGPGQSVVQVTASLNFDNVQQTSEKYDPQGVLSSETTATETSKSQTQGAKAGGATGATPNTEPTQQEGSTSNNEQTRETANNHYDIGRTVETRQFGNGDIKRLTVAVFVNERKTAAAAGGVPSYTPRTPQELNQLQDIVKQAVGFTQDTQRTDSIDVQEAQFVDMFAGAPEKQGAKEVIAGINTWLPLASQVFLVMFAIGLFFYFKNLMKGPENVTKNAEFSDLLSRFEEIENASTVGASGRDNGKALTVDEITRLIKENPANTSQAIKQWLTRN